jgi:GT2 family glycosyltransferase
MKYKEQKTSINNSKDIDIGVCILFYEKLDQTIACIKSFLPSKVNIYILNNGSSNESREALGKFCEKYGQIKIFDVYTNLGVGVGRNFLIKHTTEDWIFFVDNDIRIKTKDWVNRFQDYLSIYEDVEVFIPELYDIWTKSYTSNKRIKIEGNKAILNTEISDETTNYFPGGASFVSRKLFDRLGLYDNEMFIGLEDYEICIRGILQKREAKARIIEDIKLIHDHSRVKKEKDKDAVRERYNTDHIKKSFNRIIEKHNIFLEGDWTYWSLRAKERMLKKRKVSLKNRLKRFIPDDIKEFLKKIF